ncbi:MAG: tetratricopeptide repeat protein [Acidobacteriota bacterium]
MALIGERRETRMINRPSQFPKDMAGLVSALSDLGSLTRVSDQISRFHYGDVLSPSDLEALSREIRKLMLAPAPDAKVLSRVRLMFGEFKLLSWPPDPLGERVDIGIALSYLGWRHSALLNLASESQAWIRSADEWSRQSSAVVDLIDEGLVEAAEGTEQSIASLLPTGVDVFSAITLLRLKRNERVAACLPLFCNWLASAELNISDTEKSLLLAEASCLTAARFRLLGPGKDVRAWIATARRSLAGAPAAGPIRAKIHLIAITQDEQLHRYRRLMARCRALEARCDRYGLLREVLLCRLIAALIKKHRGHTGEALERLSALLSDDRLDAFPDIKCTALANKGELLEQEGDHEPAKTLLSDAVICAPDSMSLASALGHIGWVELEAGRPEKAIPWFRNSLRLRESRNAWYWIAYSRLLLAETLMAVGILEEARDLLISALPLTRQESMVAEEIHTVKLLKDISERFADRNLSRNRKL